MNALRYRLVVAWLLAAWLGLVGVVCHAQQLQPGVAQSFVFNDPGYFSATPVTVHYYVPTHVAPGTRVLFVIHGSGRAATTSRNLWMGWAEKNQVLVLAPEFDAARFPKRIFQLGSIEEADPSHWTFGLVERIFDAVRTSQGLERNQYLLFGHSAGGQFVHRMVLMMDKPRLQRAVAANPGTYTMPSYPDSLMDLRYPWSLSESRLAPTALAERLGRPLLLLLGEKDTITSGPSVPDGPASRAQGKHRLERGQRFFAAAQAQAQRLHADLAWQLQVVPNVGHSESAMSRVAGKWLLSGQLD